MVKIFKRQALILLLIVVGLFARTPCHKYCNLSPEGEWYSPERGVCIDLAIDNGDPPQPECLCMPGFFGPNCTEQEAPVRYTEFINRKCVALNASLPHDPEPHVYAKICGCNVGYGGATCRERCPGAMEMCNKGKGAGYCVYNFRSERGYFLCSCTAVYFGERCQIYVGLGLLALDYFYISVVFGGYVLLGVFGVVLGVYVIRVFIMANEPHPRGNLYVSLSFSSALLYAAAIGAKIANFVGFTYDMFTDKPFTFIVPIVFDQVSYGCFMSMFVMLFMKWTLVPGKKPSFFTSPSGRFTIISVANIIVVIAVALMVPLTIVTSRIGLTMFHYAFYVIIMVVFIGVYRMSFNAVTNSETLGREVFQLWLYLVSLAFTLVMVLYAVVRLMYVNALIMLLSSQVTTFILLIVFAIVEAFSALAELLLFLQVSSFIVDKQALLKYTGGIVVHWIYQRVTGKVLFLDESNEEVQHLTDQAQ